MGNKTKIFGIIVLIFVGFVVVGIAYESSTGLNMLTGERKTSGVGADKWQQESEEPEIKRAVPTEAAPTQQTFQQSSQPASQPATQQAQPTKPKCDPSYPDVCIAPYPPDLDCDEISYVDFRVTGSDPHGFDRDGDGIGCETSSSSSHPSQQTTQPKPAPQKDCDPSYPTVCIPPYPPDLDCGEIPYKRFKVLQPDPHGFDRDKDGIGCES